MEKNKNERLVNTLSAAPLIYVVSRKGAETPAQPSSSGGQFSCFVFKAAKREGRNFYQWDSHGRCGIVASFPKPSGLAAANEGVGW